VVQQPAHRAAGTAPAAPRYASATATDDLAIRVGTVNDDDDDDDFLDRPALSTRLSHAAPRPGPRPSEVPLALDDESSEEDGRNDDDDDEEAVVAAGEAGPSGASGRLVPRQSIAASANTRGYSDDSSSDDEAEPSRASSARGTAGGAPTRKKRRGFGAHLTAAVARAKSGAPSTAAPRRR